MSVSRDVGQLGCRQFLYCTSFLPSEREICKVYSTLFIYFYTVTSYLYIPSKLKVGTKNTGSSQESQEVNDFRVGIRCFLSELYICSMVISHQSKEYVVISVHKRAQCNIYNIYLVCLHVYFFQIVYV